MIAGLRLEPVEELRQIRGIAVEQATRLNQILIAGPPGSGKSSFVHLLGGWPEEGYIDLSLKGWWRAHTLSIRPREVHLGLPFIGRQEALTVFHEDWLDRFAELDLDERRILVPPPARHLLSVDWRRRFIFEILLPSLGVLVRRIEERAALGTHPVDQLLDPERIGRQLQLFARVALILHRRGMQVYVREGYHSPPARIADSVLDAGHG